MIQENNHFIPVIPINPQQERI